MTASSILGSHELAQPAPPVRVSLSTSTVVRAGLDVLLGPWRDRVVLLDAPERHRAQVDVFEPDVPQPGGRGRPTAPRIALTWDPRPAAVDRARELGAVRVLPLSVEAHRLLEVVEQLHHDHPAHGDHGDHERDPADAVGPAPRPGRPPLSAREQDVVRGITQGLSNAEIAVQLALSVNSVKTYVRTAYRKMGVASRSQAVLWGVAHGL